MVFLKFEVSAVFADSPIRRCRGVKETKEGVAKLETSLAITSIPLRRATPILECRNERHVRPAEMSDYTYLEARFPKSIPTTAILNYYF